MGAVVAGSREGGGGSLDFEHFLHFGGTGGPYIWVGYTGNVPTHWDGSGRLPPQGGPHVEGSESKEEGEWDVFLPPTVGGNVVGGSVGGGDLRCLLSEHSCTLYYNYAHYVPISSGGSMPEGDDVEAVVGKVVP